MTKPAFPRFDPDSPDELILAAFERVRSARAWNYSFDDLPDDQIPWPKIEAQDEEMYTDEGQVRGNFATTPAGILARLLLEIPCLDERRWVDRALMEHGLLAIYVNREDLDGNAHAVVMAAHELLHLEWETAVADYQRSAVDFDLALKVKSAIEGEHFRLRREKAEDPPFLTNLIALGQQLEDRFSNNRQIKKLLRTLAPSHEALALKLQLLTAEGETDDVAQWVARDVAFLAGLTVNINEGEK